MPHFKLSCFINGFWKTNKIVTQGPSLFYFKLQLMPTLRLMYLPTLLVLASIMLLVCIIKGTKYRRYKPEIHFNGNKTIVRAVWVHS